MNRRIQAIDQDNKGLSQFCKIVMNASYGSDGMNTEKFSNVKLKSKADTFISHLTGNFMCERQLNDDLYAVQLNTDRCKCMTPLQEAYFTLDNAKNRFHFIEGDTDSMYFAVAGDYYFPTTNELKEQKKLLGLSIEKEGDIMIAVSPKNYYINTIADEIIKLKGINQKQNIITKQNIIDCIGGNIMKCENMRLGQKDGVMSKLTQTKNALTGVHTKANNYVDVQPTINVE
ncbi:MAG: hypothetical protein EZS28_025841 [Streblomastix strix]|uniref:Uncharacterized protein n=1 Tax=Streblomastix strix TaxID=222440 RepID=A0A5J4V7Z3_9EUKA|nr:MAG: hypothetical protein EZS28_025841 [Streblomastix strix]